MSATTAPCSSYFERCTLGNEDRRSHCFPQHRHLTTYNASVQCLQDLEAPLRCKCFANYGPATDRDLLALPLNYAQRSNKRIYAFCTVHKSSMLATLRATAHTLV